MPADSLRRLGVVALMVLLALGVVVSVVVRRRTPQPPRPTSTTGISMGRSCAQGTTDWLDSLNRNGQRARITAAYCAAEGGALVLVEMRSQDGRAMKWQVQEGTQALPLRLLTGR